MKLSIIILALLVLSGCASYGYVDVKGRDCTNKQFIFFGWHECGPETDFWDDKK